MPFVPSAEQAAIIAHPPTQHGRLLAGPGTGKSATVLQWLTQNQGVRAKLLTFTRAATAELVAKLANANLALDKPSTIHSFCISVLLRNAGAGDFPKPLRMADDWERTEVVEVSLARRLRTTKKIIRSLFQELASNWESLDPNETEGIDPAVRARFTGGWQEHRNILGYTLLAELPFALRTALNDHNDLEGVDFGVLVVDEYQDLNACDLDVLRLIAARNCKIIAAGDDEQSIYSFRKAHPAGILRFLDEYQGAVNYPLTITRRCPRLIVDWANFVIQGDPNRDPNRQAVNVAEGAADGHAALLAFQDHRTEAQGIGRLVNHLIADKNIDADEILILLRGDHNGQFSNPIRAELTRRQIAFSDSNAVNEMLSDPANRRALSVLRVAAHREDSLAWASLMHLTPNIGATAFDNIYAKANAEHIGFGRALLLAKEQGFPNLGGALTTHMTNLVDQVLALTAQQAAPAEMPEGGWGAWISSKYPEQSANAITNVFRELLIKIDERIDGDTDLGRYLGQITPIARDIALEKSGRVRIMTLAASKGLTVKAAIIAGLESGNIPRDDADAGEERRLLYVGMTRAEQYLFGTWARRRTGPTARMGRGQVNTRRQSSPFLQNGPVNSEDGDAYLNRVSTV